MLQYYKQLDGIRGLAVLFVVFSHLFPPCSFRNYIPWGYFGVRLFFVLSGFLITGILLNATNSSFPRTSFVMIGIFYLRRSLRIFPLYYLTIILLFAFVRPRFDCLAALSLLTYTTNWYLCCFGDPAPGASHLWSLAVEEQFYLIWPWLVFFTPRQMLPLILLAVVLIGPITRLVLVILHYSVVAITFNTLACLDSLGIGGLLAWLWHRNDGGRMLKRFELAAILALFPLAVLGIPHAFIPTHYIVLFTIQDLLWACVSFLIVSNASRGIPGKFGLLLSNGPLAYCGKISYGIYIIHPFTPYISPFIFSAIGANYPESEMVRFAVMVVISLLIASMSYYLFENPINRINQYFPYEKKTNYDGYPEAVVLSDIKPRK